MDTRHLRRALAADLRALCEGKSVLGISGMTDALENLGAEYGVIAKAIRAAKDKPETLKTTYAMALAKLDLQKERAKKGGKG